LPQTRMHLVPLEWVPYGATHTMSERIH